MRGRPYSISTHLGRAVTGWHPREYQQFIRAVMTKCAPFPRQWAGGCLAQSNIPNLAAEWAALKPRLAHYFPFELDTFQKEAVWHLEKARTATPATEHGSSSQWLHNRCTCLCRKSAPF